MKTLAVRLLALLPVLVFTVSAPAADVTVYDSVVSLASQLTKNYAFTDPATAQQVVITVTMTPYSPTDPSAMFSLLDGDTRVGVDGNLIAGGKGVIFSASLHSYSGGVTPGSVKFRVAGAGIRPVDSGGEADWTSSAGTVTLTFSNSVESVAMLDTTLVSLTNSYMGQLLFPTSAGFQLTDVSAPGESLVFNATFDATLTDPRTNSWFTTYAGKYARIYTNDTSKAAGNAAVTWNNGSQAQSVPVYCGVQEVYSSSNWVYIRSTGLGSHIMGPWYLNAQRTQIFPNLPNNQKVFYRIPRSPAVPTTKSITGGGPIGYFVDGVAMFNSWDAYFWNGTADTNSGGTGYWNRDAYVNEGVTFDAAYAHQAGGQHHYHADPIALRYLLGDHVDFNPATKTYSESTNSPTVHSPILAWTAEGFPLYGPYGYSVSNDAGSGIRRMISGYVLRNGQFGTTTGRTTIPQWAVRIFNVSSNQTGPAVSTSYPLGRYMEDNDYLGDRGYVQGVDFDLDEYNGRWCVTPEFPNGVYAYFVSISSNGTPTFPYNIGRAFYGNPTGGNVTAVSETVVTNFLGGTNLSCALGVPGVNNGTVTLSWSAVEGGSYQVEATTNFSGWSVLNSGIAPNQIIGRYTNVTALDKRFYRVGRTAVAAFDSAGTTVFATPAVAPGGSGARGTTVLLTITLPSSPPQPPSDKIPTSVAISGAVTTTNNISRPTTGTVQALLTIPAGATVGTTNVVVIFNPAPTYTLTNGFTIN